MSDTPQNRAIFQRWIASPAAGYCRQNPDGSRYDWSAEKTAHRPAAVNITEAELQALEYVAVVGHVATHDGPHISSLLERLRPFAKRETDRPQAVAWLAFATDGSESSAVYMMQEQAQAAADEWGWSIAPLYTTPPAHATHGEGSVRGGGTSIKPEELDCVRAAIRLLEHSTNTAADRAREGLLSIYRRFAGG